MYDLKKIEKNFHDLIGNAMPKDCYDDFEFPALTMDLSSIEESIMPPGDYLVYFFYFLKCEDEKCLLYVNVFPVDELFIIDENSYKWIKNGDYKKVRAENNIGPSLEMD